MDSVTQVILGASVGEAVLGKRVGNKAALWGAVAGTIPDLDFVINPLFDQVTRITIHRGFSHSILFAFIMAPALAYLITKLYKKKEAGFCNWTLLMFLGLITHVALDCFTTYGTRIFAPFSDYQFSLSSIYVIDPFYSVPFLLLLLTALFFNRTSTKRRLLNYAGLTISSVYLAFTVANKEFVDGIFIDEFQKEHKGYAEYMSAPTPFNNFLWRGVFKVDGGYYEGYYSIFDESPNIKFRFIDKNEEYAEQVDNTEAINTLEWFSEGFYAYTYENGKLYFNDLRFGSYGGWEGEDIEDYLFSFRITRKKDEVKVERVYYSIDLENGLVLELIERIRGS